MANEDGQRKPSKEAYASGLRIKDHKIIKKVASDRHIKVHGQNTRKPPIRLKRPIFMPIMLKLSGVHGGENVPRFGAKPTCMPKAPRARNGFYMCIGSCTISFASILPPRSSSGGLGSDREAGSGI